MSGLVTVRISHVLLGTVWISHFWVSYGPDWLIEVFVGLDYGLC